MRAALLLVVAALAFTVPSVRADTSVLCVDPDGPSVSAEGCTVFRMESCAGFVCGSAGCTLDRVEGRCDGSVCVRVACHEARGSTRVQVSTPLQLDIVKMR